MPCPGLSRVLAIGLCLAPTAGWAQPAEGYEEPIGPDAEPIGSEEVIDRSRYERAITVAVRESRQDRVIALGPKQSYVTLSAGALGFMGEGMTPGPALGPAWSLRYGFQPLDGIVGWEIGMLTSTHAGQSELEANVFLMETGLKMSAAQHRPWSPLVAVGIGYGMFAGPVQSDLATLVVPLSVGLEGGTEQILVGMRATWRPSFFDRDVIGVGAGHDTWQVVADVGTRF